MMSSSLKPGGNYRDGSCYCDETNTACPAGQTCDNDSKKCKSDTGQDNFCLEDKECPLNNPVKQCVNKKYVTLVDRSAFPVGWWVTKENLDTIAPLDSYADQTKGLINHTRFIEVTSYGAEMGSGVKDAFQNCFLPSAGPGVGVDCPVTAARPYCCNGVAMSQEEWEGSACFTGY